MNHTHSPKSKGSPWLWAAAILLVIGSFLGFWRHAATGSVPPNRAWVKKVAKATDFALAPKNNRPSGTPANPDFTQAKPRRIKPSSLSSGTESGQYGQVELVDAGDDTPHISEFVIQQAEMAHAKSQACLLVTMVPQCPGCASLGYALIKSPLRNRLGKVRIVRLDLDEFEEELRNLHLPIDRVPGFVRLDPHGNAVDFLDAGEWNTNDPAEYAPIIQAFLQGRLKVRRHPWVRNSDSSAVDL